MNELTIIVSRPCAALRSNGGHGNRYSVARARRDAKSEGWIQTLISPGLAVGDGENVNIEYCELLGPGARRMDDDNLVGAMKLYRDGIAQALGIDDSRMRIQPTAPPERGPISGVRVRLWTVQAHLPTPDASGRPPRAAKRDIRAGSPALA
jgi:hypothetical protein